MDIVFTGLIIFLFLLAVFDLSVGVSNDAVNFLNSSLGARAGSFRTVIIVAAAGVFIGATMSNGMMDIARHGIFKPENFSYYDIICIFMAVMVTDIILLDVFNSLGMPTSTTVSMVFELLGASFVVAMIKVFDADGAGIGDYLNTAKAFSVILGIFLSVAIAFVFGSVVQFITRAIFSFDYKSRMKWKIGIFGGISLTMILYFILIKGIKDLSFMTPDIKSWIDSHTMIVLGASFVFFTLLSQGLHALKVNVLKVIALCGTFALALAFAGNDLVNFIGVPVTGLSAHQDYMANGAGNPTGFMMDSLNGSADTPFYFLLGAGVIMVVALATSKKARNVSKTEIGLGSQGEGEEQFGSSAISRRLVRITIRIYRHIYDHTPQSVRRWFAKRFDVSKTQAEEGASFDLIRASVNLMLASMLIAGGTSLKLPLSTTFVTFMVAMGTSLADRAWGRESAVYRITGVLSVIGGWFITAGVAFIGAGLIVLAMHKGGVGVMVLIAAVAVAILIRSELRYSRKRKEEKGDTLLGTLLHVDDKAEAWSLLRLYISSNRKSYLELATGCYSDITRGFLEDNNKLLTRSGKLLGKQKPVLKDTRRRETLGLRRCSAETAIINSAWFHLSNNAVMSINYNLRRMEEICAEHVRDNLRPLPQRFADEFAPLRMAIVGVLEDAAEAVSSRDIGWMESLRKNCDMIKDCLSECRQSVLRYIREGNQEDLGVCYVYLNLLQESQEMASGIRKLLRASIKMEGVPADVLTAPAIAPADA